MPCPPLQRRPWLVVVVAGCIVLAIFGLWSRARAQDAQNAQNASGVGKAAARQSLDEFMKRKLDLSHGLLAGLSTNDLEHSADQAQRLSLLCLDEDWNLIKTPEYAERSAEFRRTANTIAKAAREKNLAAAQLSYVQLVGQCFSCHQSVRDARK